MQEIIEALLAEVQKSDRFVVRDEIQIPEIRHCQTRVLSELRRHGNRFSIEARDGVLVLIVWPIPADRRYY